MDKTVLYASVDNIWFSEHRLYDLAVDFVKRGGKYLFLGNPNLMYALSSGPIDIGNVTLIFAKFKFYCVICVTCFM